MAQDLPARCKIVTLPSLGDQRGSLTPIERATGLSFDIARVYFIYGTVSGVSRGFHAHRNLNQLAVCVSGSCNLVVDDGSKRSEVRLDGPEHGLEMGRMIWREMHDFSADCVLAVLADRPYDKFDYIRDYEEFVRLARRG